MPYRTAADIIDWSIPCPSIFERKRPLAVNTLRRIAEGIRRYVIEAERPFIAPVAASAGGMGKTALVSAFLAQHNGGYCTTPARPMTAPVSTVSSRGSQQQLVTSHLLKLRGSCRDGQAVTAPAPTTTAGGTHIGEVRAFLMKYYGTGGQWQAVDSPAHTVTTKGRLGLVTVMVRGEPYVIADIGMRMLQPRELFRAQGFSDAYRIDIDIDGRKITKTDQVRCCGNSVCPPVAAAIVSVNYESAAAEKAA